MTAYRFCRTDDIDLLVDAWGHCRGPEDADQPALDRQGFKDLIRQQDLWCSSCMVALEGREPVGVLLGAKRPESTLVYGLRVHPGHRRHGHARHLLTSLGQKLAILGPPRLVAEVPADREAARAVFAACGWSIEGRLRDWSCEPAVGTASSPVITPITLADLNGSLPPAGARAWHRDAATLAKQADAIEGLGFHSPERLEAWVFHRGPEILLLGFEPGELGVAGLRALVAALGGEPLILARAARDELADPLLTDLGFRPGAEHLIFATEAKAA